jgi:hypothetical protein
VKFAPAARCAHAGTRLGDLAQGRAAWEGRAAWGGQWPSLAGARAMQLPSVRASLKLAAAAHHVLHDGQGGGGGAPGVAKARVVAAGGQQRGAQRLQRLQHLETGHTGLQGRWGGRAGGACGLAGTAAMGRLAWLHKGRTAARSWVTRCTVHSEWHRSGPRRQSWAQQLPPDAPRPRHSPWKCCSSWHP